MDINLYNTYIRAWSHYEEDKLMSMLKKYFGNELKNSSDWYDIKYFHDNFSIKRGDYYNVDSDYAIGDIDGNVVWEGDYPSEAIIKNILNNY